MISILAVEAPPPSWAGVLTAVSVVLLNVGGVVTAVSLALNRRRTAKRLDAYQRDTTGRLAVIHTLVNSTLTAAMQAELDASRRELLMLREVITLRANTGQPASAEQSGAVGLLERKIAGLTLAMRDREATAAVADEQIEAERQRRESD